VHVGVKPHDRRERGSAWLLIAFLCFVATAIALPFSNAFFRLVDAWVAETPAVTLVLLSVFVPAAFIPGISGELFRQFAVAVSASMVISAINALTLSPRFVLCS
jgi:hypothetical protein